MRPFDPVEVTRPDAAMLDRIGRLRVEVWRSESVLDLALFPTGIWLDEFDPIARHWVVADEAGALVAVARLTVHATRDESPDGSVWRAADRALPGPVANIAKLVVHASARGRGLASRLNTLRVDAAREAGARSITVTASAANARLLAPLGFVDTGLVATFANRPGVPFHALECVVIR